MRVAFVTQAYDPDHPYVGTAVDWVRALAERSDGVDVIASWVGRGAPTPPGVRVYSMGKEAGASRLGRGLALHAHLARLVGGQRVDAVFAHMCPGFAIAAAPYARVVGAPIVLWYAHKQVTVELRVAFALVDALATVSADELGIGGRKVHVLGHGIDRARFAPAAARRGGPPWEVVMVGRLAPVKRIEIVLDAAEALEREGRAADFRFKLVGGLSSPDHGAYVDRLRVRVDGLSPGLVELVGAVPHSTIAEVYRRAHAYVSAYDGEGWDKATLEALASGLPCFVAGSTVRSRFGSLDRQLGFGDGVQLAGRLSAFFGFAPERRDELARQCRSIADGQHDVGQLMDAVASLFRELRPGRAAA